MVQKNHPQGVIWVPSCPPQAGHLSEKNDNLAVQYEDCPWFMEQYTIPLFIFSHGYAPFFQAIQPQLNTLRTYLLQTSAMAHKKSLPTETSATPVSSGI
jgi:hypothetical protein